MKESPFGFQYSWEDLAPIRPLFIVGICCQFMGAVIGVWWAPTWTLYDDNTTVGILAHGAACVGPFGWRAVHPIARLNTRFSSESMAQLAMLTGARVTKSLMVATALAGALAIQGCAGGGASRAATEEQSRPATIPEVRRDAPAGYLVANAVPNSLALLPPPPSTGSVAFALDEDVSRKSLALRDTLRGALATEDADLAFPRVAGTFSCALDTSITQQDTPRLYMLLERSLVDAFHSTTAAKDHYLRVRPYLVNKVPPCAPAGSIGSYPSGHATAGWAWALILGEIAPERIDAILLRGRAFGQSRLICNAHWQSDVDEGRFLGASTVASLHADPDFRSDVESAKAEIVAARAKGLRPQRDCAAEAEAMALQPLPLR